MLRNARKAKSVICCFIGIIFGYNFSSMIYSIQHRQPISCVESVQIQQKPEDVEKHLLFVGVMTANKFLDTRALAVYQTWGKMLPGKIVFFSSEKSSTKAAIPLVKLPGVDDSYPPQNKSLEMMKYMYENYPNYEFYFRADDDLYVQPDKLFQFLSSINSSKPLLIGHPGYGIKKERPLLHLVKGQPFCMGGPGIVISNKAMQLFYKHIDKCPSITRSPHEDVELWRCMRRYVGISCTKSNEVANIFSNNNGLAKAFDTGKPLKDVVHTMTAHPLKNPDHQYKLFVTFQVLKMQEKEYEIRQAMREIKEMELLVNYTLNPSTQLDQAEEGIFIDNFATVMPSSEYLMTEWALFYSGTHYSSDTILEGRMLKDSSINVAMKNTEEIVFALNSDTRSKFVSDIYARNLPGVGAEYIVKIRLVSKRKKHNMKSLSKIKEKIATRTVPIKKMYHITIPYGSLMVRENEGPNFLDAYTNIEEFRVNIGMNLKLK